VETISEKFKLILRGVTDIWRVIKVDGVKLPLVVKQKHLIIYEDGTYLFILE